MAAVTQAGTQAVMNDTGGRKAEVWLPHAAVRMRPAELDNEPGLRTPDPFENPAELSSCAVEACQPSCWMGAPKRVYSGGTPESSTYVASTGTPVSVLSGDSFADLDKVDTAPSASGSDASTLAVGFGVVRSDVSQVAASALSGDENVQVFCQGVSPAQAAAPTVAQSVGTALNQLPTQAQQAGQPLGGLSAAGVVCVDAAGNVVVVPVPMSQAQQMCVALPWGAMNMCRPAAFPVQKAPQQPPSQPPLDQLIPETPAANQNSQDKTVLQRGRAPRQPLPQQQQQQHDMKKTSMIKEDQGSSDKPALALRPPSGLTCLSFSNGHTTATWHVQRSKLSSLLEQLVSPTFSVDIPGWGSHTFRLLLVAAGCEAGGRHTKSFRRSRGRASVLLKCQDGQLPEDFPELTFRMGLSTPTKKLPVWRPPGPPARHNFTEKSCASLPQGIDEWDVRTTVGLEDSFTVHLLIQVDSL